MTLHSLAYRTDLIFARFDAEIRACGTYMTVRTPTNPQFHWGNFLLFDHAPAPDDGEHWQRLFAAEIGTPPQVAHIALGWDSTDGDAAPAAPFAAAGFHVERTRVLTADRALPPLHYDPGLSVRPLTEDWEWDAATKLQIGSRETVYSLDGFTAFKTAKMQRYRVMSRAGLGDWYGAFDGDTLVGDLGLFADDTLARFQSVETHPDYRRGICRTLVYHAAEHLAARLGPRRLVIVTEPDSLAERVYRAVGFTPTEFQIGVCKW